MEQLNNLDAVILIGFLISMLVAFIRGFVKEVLSVLGLVLFIFTTIKLSPPFSEFVNKYVESEILSQTIVFIIIMAIFYSIWIISTDKLIARIRTSTLSFMDRLFGLVFGFLRAVLILSFCFLIVKIVLPEELKDGELKKSKYFMMAEGCSNIIEKMLPDELVKNTMKTVEESVADINKVKNVSEKTKEIEPSLSDKEQMDKMFELLVKPEIKKQNKAEEISKSQDGYNSKDIEDLDNLINDAI